MNAESLVFSVNNASEGGSSLTGSNYNQLRFDILEKVRLQPQQPGIQTLLELDLYPDVEVEDQGTHLKIQGFLRLNGKYAGEGSTEKGADHVSETKSEGAFTQSEPIAYVIPVEITLPANRVDMDHITSEIQSFDYKVLSPFELQIDAVLVIDGLLEEPQKEAEKEADYEVVDRYQFPTFTVPKQGEDSALAGEDSQPSRDYDDPEDYEFVHVARVDDSSPETEPSSLDDGEEVSPSFSAEDSLSSSDDQAVTAQLFNQTEEPEEPQELQKSQELQDLQEPQESHEIQEASAEESTEITSEAAESAEEHGTNEDGEDSPAEPTDSPKEKSSKNTIVAFKKKGEGSKEDWKLADRFLRQPNQNDFVFREGVPNEDESDLLQDQIRTAPVPDQDDEQMQPDPELLETEETESDDAAEENKGSRLEWARWILGEEEERFVKMRMVIVQKEDSIDGIAERYKVSPSKILHLNKMESDVLEEGQIVYIPGQ
jgi:stage VI sporulation protein D